MWRWFRGCLPSTQVKRLPSVGTDIKFKIFSEFNRLLGAWANGYKTSSYQMRSTRSSGKHGVTHRMNEHEVLSYYASPTRLAWQIGKIK